MTIVWQSPNLGYSTNFGWTQCQWVQMGYNICYGHYFHATFKWGISLAISKSSHGPQLFDFNTWCPQDIIFDYWDGLGKDGWTHKNGKADTPMANVKWGASNTNYLEGSGQGCWRGGRVFWNKWKSSIDYGKTRWIYIKQNIQVVVRLLVIK